MATIRATNQVYVDGRSERRRVVELRFGDMLQIFENGAFVAAWAPVDIRRVAAGGGALAVRALTAPPKARLEISDAALAAAIAQRCGLLDGETQEARGQRLRIADWSFAAVASLAAILWYGVPLAADGLAPFVPRSVERRIGEVADKQARAMFKGKVCASPAGDAALARLAVALERAAGAPLDTRVVVLSSPVPNAFALPGGKVYLLRGLIDAAHSPDEVAGVLAHEFGHVAHRDGMRAVIKQGGAAFVLGLVFGDVFGAGAILAAARASLSAAYSREAETQADDFAVATMRRAGRSARPLGEFLTRVANDDAMRPIAFLRDHPLSSDRLTRIAQRSGDATGAPLLSGADWTALKAICR